MLEPIADLPAGTVGFRAQGELTRADYYETLVPALRRAAAAGAMRLLVVAEGVEKLDLAHVLGQARTDISLGALERIALVTDVGWIRAATHLFGRFLPGELRVFGLGEEDQARAWVAA